MNREAARLRVLIADDDPVICLALRALIESEPDMEVVAVAADAAEAIAMAVQFEPAVAILDVRMPGGGVHAASELRSWVPDTGLVAFSAAGDARAIAQMAEVGVTEYVVKGAPNEEILAAVRRLGRR